jgi:hypothetical protein
VVQLLLLYGNNKHLFVRCFVQVVQTAADAALIQSTVG